MRLLQARGAWRCQVCSPARWRAAHPRPPGLPCPVHPPRAARARAAVRGRPGQRRQRHPHPAGRAGRRARPADAAGGRRGAQVRAACGDLMRGVQRAGGCTARLAGCRAGHKGTARAASHRPRRRRAPAAHLPATLAQPAGALDLQALAAQVPGSGRPDHLGPSQGGAAAEGGWPAGCLEALRRSCARSTAAAAAAAAARAAARPAPASLLVNTAEAPPLTAPHHLCQPPQVLANDGVGVIVRACRWRPADPAFRPKQEASAGPMLRARPLPPSRRGGCCRCCGGRGRLPCAGPSAPPPLGPLPCCPHLPATCPTRPPALILRLGRSAGAAGAREPRVCARHRRQRLLLPLHRVPEPGCARVPRAGRRDRPPPLAPPAGAASREAAQHTG